MVSDFPATCITVDESITARKPRRTASSYIGERFEHLLIVELVEQSDATKVLCRCDCGNEKIVRLGNVTRGLTRSCGCLPRGHLVQESQKRPLRNQREIAASPCSDGLPHTAHTWRDPNRSWRDPAGRVFCDGVPS